MPSLSSLHPTCHTAAQVSHNYSMMIAKKNDENVRYSAALKEATSLYSAGGNGSVQKIVNDMNKNTNFPVVKDSIL